MSSTDRRTDGRTDGQGESSIPPTPSNFVGRGYNDIYLTHIHQACTKQNDVFNKSSQVIYSSYKRWYKKYIRQLVSGRTVHREPIKACRAARLTNKCTHQASTLLFNWLFVWRRLDRWLVWVGVRVWCRTMSIFWLPITSRWHGVLFRWPVRVGVMTWRWTMC